MINLSPAKCGELLKWKEKGNYIKQLSYNIAILEKNYPLDSIESVDIADQLISAYKGLIEKIEIKEQ